MTEDTAMSERRKYYETIFLKNARADWDAAPGKEVVISSIVQSANDRDHLKGFVALCDLGCGSGYLLNRIREAVKTPWQYVGIDFSESAVTSAKLKFPEFQFFCEDGSHTHLDSDSFDLIVSYGSIEHFLQPRRSIVELSRLLKPGGCYFTMIPTLGVYRTDRQDEGWYDDLTGQPQWNLTRQHWQEHFHAAGLKL